MLLQRCFTIYSLHPVCFYKIKGSRRWHLIAFAFLLFVLTVVLVDVAIVHTSSLQVPPYLLAIWNGSPSEWSMILYPVVLHGRCSLMKAMSNFSLYFFSCWNCLFNCMFCLPFSDIFHKKLQWYSVFMENHNKGSFLHCRLVHILEFRVWKQISNFCVPCYPTKCF